MNILFITRNQLITDNTFIPTSIAGGWFDELDIMFSFRALGHQVYQVDHCDWDGENFTKMFCRVFIKPLPFSAHAR